MPGRVVSTTSSLGIGVHSAINSATALLSMVVVLSNFKAKLGSSSAHSTILRWPRGSSRYAVAEGGSQLLFRELESNEAASSKP